MNRLVRQSWCSICLLLAVAGCGTLNHTQRGAVLGGATGTAFGAAIGQAAGKTGAGAAIGAGVGSLTGALLGNSVDHAENEQLALEASIENQSITIADAVQLSRAGLSPSVIITQIQTRGVGQRPSSNDLIYLKQEGVADSVIEALQRGSLPQMSQPVVVPYVVPPPPRFYGSIHIPLGGRHHRFHHRHH